MRVVFAYRVGNTESEFLFSCMFTTVTVTCKGTRPQKQDYVGL